MIGCRNWIQKLLNDQMEKLFNNPKVPNQANQIQTQIMTERGNQLFAVTPVTRKLQEKTSRSQEIETRSFHEKAVKHDRTVKPVVCRDTSHVQSASQTRSSHDSKNFNVEDGISQDRTGKLVVCRDTNSRARSRAITVERG